MPRFVMIGLLAAVTLCLSTRLSVNAVEHPPNRVDLFPECTEWADRGDCDSSGRPFFMQRSCPESCQKKVHETTKPPEARKIPDEKQDELYELSAKDARTGKAISMENFEGYVTVIANSARVCGFSATYYEALEHIHSIYPYALEVLSFPFDHPNIPAMDECKDEIVALEQKEDRKIHVMEPVEINGPNTHPIYKYLKSVFDMDEMDMNFAHYFFINPDGNVIEVNYGISYTVLKRFIDTHVHNDLRT